MRPPSIDEPLGLYNGKITRDPIRPTIRPGHGTVAAFPPRRHQRISGGSAGPRGICIADAKKRQDRGDSPKVHHGLCPGRNQYALRRFTKGLPILRLAEPLVLVSHLPDSAASVDGVRGRTVSKNQPPALLDPKTNGSRGEARRCGERDGTRLTLRDSVTSIKQVKAACQEPLRAYDE